MGIAHSCDPPPNHRVQTLIQIVDAAVADAYRRGGSTSSANPAAPNAASASSPSPTKTRPASAKASKPSTKPTLKNASSIRTRVADSLTRLDPWFPGDLATGILNEDHEAAILFEEFANDEPCPVLDLEHGTCDLYEHRPILCRTFGPPMRTEENNLATCELCYIHASTEEIAACELDPTIPAQEEASNEAYNAAHGLHGQTLIAYALRGA